MNYSKKDDTSLIKRISHGDEQALSALYDRYSRLVYSVAYHVVGDLATAEEVTLDIFTRVWDKAATYQSQRAKVSTWLTSMTRNRAIDMLRREAVRPEKESVSWADVHADPISRDDNPEMAVSQRQQRERVRQALTQLPEEQQQVLALAYFRGRTQREIAADLDLPLGTVKTRVRLAMNKLRQLLGDAW